MSPHAEHILEGFFVGLATATAAAIVAGVVGLIRFIRRTDAHRMSQIVQSEMLGARVEHRQGHVIRWAKQVGRKVGIPFPLPDDYQCLEDDEPSDSSD